MIRIAPPIEQIQAARVSRLDRHVGKGEKAPTSNERASGDI